MMEIEYIPLKITDGRICGYARIRGGSAEIRLRPPQDGRVLVFTESGVADGVPDTRIPLSAQAAAVALHENGTLRCCGFSRTTAMNLSELRRRVRALAPESAPRTARKPAARPESAPRGAGDAEIFGGEAGSAPRGAGDAEIFAGAAGSAARGAGNAEIFGGEAGSASRGAGNAEIFGGEAGSASRGAGNTEIFAGAAGSAARGAGNTEIFAGAAGSAARGAGDTEIFAGAAGSAARGAGNTTEAAKTVAGKTVSASRGAGDVGELAKSVAGKTDSAESPAAGIRDTAKQEKDADACFFADGADADGDSLSRAALYARAERMLRRLAALTDPGTADEEPMFAPAQEPAKPDAAGRTADAPSETRKAPAQAAERAANPPRNARNISLDAAGRTADAPSEAWKAPAQAAERTAHAAEAAPAEAFESAIPTVGDLPYGRSGGGDPLRLPEHDSAPAPEQTSVANPFPHIFPGAAFVRGADGTLSGVWRNGGMRADISAVPGQYSPQPPAHLSGYTRYIRARSGGFWVRVAER